MKRSLNDHLFGPGPKRILALDGGGVRGALTLSYLERMEALLRRVQKENRIPVQSFHFGDIEIDFERAVLLKGGQPVTLASKELQLLRYLVDNRGRVVPREELLQNVWEYSSDVSSRTIDVHVAWLRQKLEDNPQNPKHIHTIRGKGYRFSS